MLKIMDCRRTFITFFGVCCLLALGLINDIDTSMSIAAAVAALCGANSWEKRGQS